MDAGARAGGVDLLYGLTQYVAGINSVSAIDSRAETPPTPSMVDVTDVTHRHIRPNKLTIFKNFLVSGASDGGQLKIYGPDCTTTWIGAPLGLGRGTLPGLDSQKSST